MTTAEIELIAYRAYWRVYNNSPIDTGNLRFNALRIVQLSKKHWEVYIDQKIAPYMPYTNEPWLSPKWNGKKNPNEGWWDDTAKLIYEEIENAMRGKI